MNTSTRLGYSLTLAALLSLILPAHRALAAEDEGLEARSVFKKTANAILQSGDYELLEQTAQDLRTGKATFRDGLWKLKTFYDGIGTPRLGRITEADWKEFFDRMEAWKKAFPESMTRPVAHAAGLTDYAWVARGSGYANTITEEGGKAFNQRLADARKVLEEAGRLPARCPTWFGEMQRVALGEGWDMDKYEELFKKAVQAEPTYYQYYLLKATHLLPRWYGRPGDVERFADEVGKKYDAALGNEMYARIAWSNVGNSENFHQSGFKWDKVKLGFQDLEKRCPDSAWNLNGFCQLAWAAGDKTTAHELIGKIGDRFESKAWRTGGALEVVRKWSDPATPKEQLVPVKMLTYESSNRPNAVAYSRDGKQLFAGYADGQVLIWDLASGKHSKLLDDGPIVSHLTLSPDGKLLAAAIGGDHDDGAPSGMTRLWDLATRKQIDSHSLKPVWSVAFSPDGKRMAASGGTYKKQGEGVFIDLETKQVTEIPWPAKHRHHVQSIVLSPDGKTLIADCNKSITVWDLEQQKQISKDGQVLQHFIQRLTFSPDGKLLAGAACALAFDDPGAVVLWDTATWTVITPGIKSQIGYGTSVAFSPDGKLLAAGSNDTSVRLWRTDTWEEVAAYISVTRAIIVSVAFAPDGKTLAAGDRDGAISLWAVAAR